MINTRMLRRIFLPVLFVLVAAGWQRDHESDLVVVDGPSHNGVEIAIDLPQREHVKNFGAPDDGAGLCVFASIDMLARWHHISELIDVIHKLRKGGGYPQKVDDVIKEYGPKPGSGFHYIQYEDTNPAVMDAAIAQRQGVCVTYGIGEKYMTPSNPTGTIYHMVLLCHFDSKYACIIDNNFPELYFWMSRETFLKRWVHPTGKGWAIIFQVAPPPPIPRSKS